MFNILKCIDGLIHVVPFLPPLVEFGKSFVQKYWGKEIINECIQIDRKYVIGGIVGGMATFAGIRVVRFIGKRQQDAMENELAEFGCTKEDILTIEYALANLDEEKLNGLLRFAEAKAAWYSQYYRNDFQAITASISDNNNRSILKIKMKRSRSSEVWSEGMLERDISEEIIKLIGEEVHAPPQQQEIDVQNENPRHPENREGNQHERVIPPIDDVVQD